MVSYQAGCHSNKHLVNCQVLNIKCLPCLLPHITEQLWNSEVLNEDGKAQILHMLLVDFK